MHRVGLGVFDFNDSAIACYERAGFRREGVLREIDLRFRLTLERLLRQTDAVGLEVT